jgi:Ca2+-binding RTX toxin-like protein
MFRKYAAPKLVLFFTLLVLLGVILVVSYSAFSAANSVPLSRLGLSTQAVLLEELLPNECSGIAIATIVYCKAQGACVGSGNNDLILGTSGNDKIKGQAGDDCILGGGGDDEIDGGAGNDVCLGGPGTDTFESCEFSQQ